MADAPAPPARRSGGGLNLAKPGMKEWLIIGGIAAVVGAIYLWRKNQAAQQASAAAAQQANTSATAPVVGGAGNGTLGIPTSALFTILQNHMQGPAGPTGAAGAAGATGATGAPGPTGSTTTTGGGTTTTAPPAAQMVTVPVTYGQRADAAIATLTAAGFTVTTNPARNASMTYVSIGSSPEGGRQAPKGSHVTLNVKQKTY